jgi:sec-independent protein translocase protein TatA
MGSLSVWHWLIFLAVALLFFGGGGKISAVMGDFAKGIKSFKKGLQDDEADAAAKPADQPRTIESSKAHESHVTGSGTKVG